MMVVLSSPHCLGSSLPDLVHLTASGNCGDEYWLLTAPRVVVQSGSILAPRRIERKQDFGKYLVSFTISLFSAPDRRTKQIPARMSPPCHSHSGHATTWKYCNAPSAPTVTTMPITNNTKSPDQATIHHPPTRSISLVTTSRPALFRRPCAKPISLAASAPFQDLTTPQRRIARLATC